MQTPTHTNAQSHVYRYIYIVCLNVAHINGLLFRQLLIWCAHLDYMKENKNTNSQQYKFSTPT